MALAATLVVALALVLRLGVIAASPDFQPIFDAADFDRLARSIAATGHYPETRIAKPGTATAFNPPGYPHLLAVTYSLAGHSLTVGRILSALLGTATVGLLVLIAWRLSGPVAGVTAGLLAAVYPPLVMINASLISEALFLPLMLGLVLLLVAWREVRGAAALWVAVAAGVLCGLAALTRFVGVMLIFGVMAWIWSRRLTRGRRLTMGGLAVLAAALAISPWTLRNARVFDAFVPIATEGGAAAVGTYNAHSARPGRLQGLWRPTWTMPEYRHLFNATQDEAQLDRRWRSDAVLYASRHPTYPFVALARNGLRMFGIGPGHRFVERLWYSEMGIPIWAHAWMRVSVYLMASLALLGLIVARRRRARPAEIFVWLIPVLLFVSAAFFLGAPRYRAPLDPFLVLAAASGVAAVLSSRHVAEPPAPRSPATIGT